MGSEDTMDQTTSSAELLRRKMETRRENTRTGQRSLVRAMRLAVAMAGTERYQLPLAAIDTQQSRARSDELEEWMHDGALLVLIEGSHGRIGAFSIDRSLVEALVQKQTVGNVFDTPVGDRCFTGTDAALIEPLIESILDHASKLAEIGVDQRCVRGFRFAGHVMSRRALGLSLQAGEYRLFRLMVDVDSGVKQGNILIILPDDPVPASSTGDETDHQSQRTLRPTVERARVSMNTVLAKMRLSLAELTQLKPGDLVNLHEAYLQETALVDGSGQTFAVGHLGRVDGVRAIRLTREPNVASGAPSVSQMDDFNADPLTVSPEDGEPQGDGLDILADDPLLNLDVSFTLV
jgi:flagellar motor switch/type III secretory pathway protein FliN